MTPLRVLIVDDEPPARRRLRRLVSAEPGAEVVGEAGDARTALDRARALRPDVMLVDVQLPGLSGLEVVERLPPPGPRIVFVTAHESYAVRAFELDAIDYLLKPVTRSRLREALERARRRGAAAPAPDPAGRPPGSPARLAVRSQGRLDLVELDAIDWFEAADNYVILHCGRRSHLLRETLTSLAERLDRTRFARIHRSTIVPVERIVRLDPAAHGDWTVVLRDGTRLVLSRTYRRDVLARLGRGG
jgi:two-component system LytT family response regulator